MKTIVAVIALVGLAWWLQRQIAVSRRDEPTTLDRLRKVLERKAA